jgi:hypothetical protein
MRKKNLIFLLVFWLFSPFFLLSTPEEKKTGFTKSDGLKREIRLLNLLNGLELNTEQMEMILVRAEECRKVRQEFETMLYHRKAEMESVLGEIKTYLEDNQELPPSLAQRFHRLETEHKEARMNMENKIKERALEVKEALNEHQLYQFKEFIPCIIPPKGELRIGQAQDYKGLTRKMERIRELPYRFYERKRDEIVERTLRGMKLHAPRGQEIDEKQLKNHISSVLDKIRSLKEAEFEIQKDKLAEELISPIKPQALAKNLSINRKVEAFLLSPEIIPIIQEKLKQSVTGK